MIALHCRWGDGAFDPQAIQRFTASLGAGINRPVGQESDDRATFAALCATRAQARGWRVARAPGGERVLFTGYLDHAEEAKRELGLVGDDAATLYAAGYARWGDAVDLRLLGQFATIVVPPGARWVRCARSPIQAPPLHIWRDPVRVMVASVARVLFATGEVRAEVDEQKIADSLYLNYADATLGWYKGVERVAIGAQVVIARDASRARRYYDISAVPRVRLGRDEDYVEAANALLLRGTQAALTGFARPAISLSGGLDSQAVAAFALEARPGEPLLGLTSVPEPGWHGEDGPRSFADEREHVAALAALYPDLETETIDAAGLSFDHLLPAMFLMAGCVPRNAMNLHWIHALSARARARGCDVLLVGEMGNHSFSFSGAGALPSWLARGRWTRLLRELDAVRGDQPLARTLFRKALLPLLPDPLVRRFIRARGLSQKFPYAEWCPMRADYARDMQVERRAAELGYDTGFRTPRSSDAYRRQVFGNATNEGGDIRQALDLIHGLPSRDPTAYRPLVEFCAGIPDEQYLRDGQRRWLARRMLHGRVPAMVATETRRGRQAADWPLRVARQREALIAELNALGDDPAMAARFDLPRLTHALESMRDGTPASQADATIVQLAIPRAIATARFIRFVEGTNRR